MPEMPPLVLSHPAPNPAWLGKLSEDAIDPDLPIVDPHHHLWNHHGNTYFLDQLLADTGSVSTIVVRCITRRSAGSCGVTACIVQRLSHITTSCGSHSWE